MKKTKYYSYLIGELADGCKLCVEGKKLVLFVTGLCPERCFYCPISDKKFQKDVTYANEWPTGEVKDIIKEARLCSAEGAGITGGDPLVRLGRTVFFIKELKKKFGKKFHIHLYTPLKLVTQQKLKKLYEAGLDEIRFHLNLDSDELYDRIRLPLKFDWNVGVEIPVIPGYEEKLKKIIMFLDKVNKNSDNKIKFLNLNELEISDTNAQHLVLRGYKTKDRVSYGVLGSEKIALRLLKFIEDKKIKLNAHYCTTTLKDKVQLANRVKKRAVNVAKKYEYVDSDGMITRGAIYFRELMPSAGYRDKIDNIVNDKQKKSFYLNKLKKTRNELMRKFKIKGDRIDIDSDKLRMYIDGNVLFKIKDKLDRDELMPAIVREYPTWDQLELDVDFL